SAFVAVLMFAASRVLQAMAALSLRTAHGGGRPAFGDRMGEVLRRFDRLVGVALVMLWAYATLRALGVWNGIVGLGAALLARRLAIGSIDLSLGDLFAFAVSLALAILVARLLRFFLDDVVLPAVTLPRGVPAAVSRTVQYAIIGIGVVAAFMAAGLDMGRFGFLAGALGVGIGFGLQNVVN